MAAVRARIQDQAGRLGLHKALTEADSQKEMAAESTYGEFSGTPRERRHGHAPERGAMRAVYDGVRPELDAEEQSGLLGSAAPDLHAQSVIDDRLRSVDSTSGTSETHPP